MNPSTPASDPVPPVALIAGPTASGKSALAVALARSLRADGLSAVIINADASQVYADIPILSARPTQAEMAGIPHRLFGHIDGAEVCDAARWAAEASSEIAAAHASGALPILVGGTGLYLDTLLRGIAPVPPIAADVRTMVRALSVTDAHERLVRLDPAAAVRLKPRDRTRITRALEVVLATGRPLSEWQRQRSGGISDSVRLAPSVLLPPRDWLRARCDTRLERMFADGAIAEVQALLDRRLDPALPVMNAIGVPQIATWLAEGGVSGEGRAWPLEQTRIATRQFAKRQFTWFRNQPPGTWVRFESELNDDTVSQIVIKLRQMLLT